MKKIKIKALGFEVEFKGNGCVNWDSNEQKFMLLANGLIGGKIDDNVKFAKKSFVKTEDGIGFLYKVSNDAIRHNMWEKEMPFFNENVAQLPYVYYNMLGRPCMLDRGYMFASKNASITSKKKSPITITDAVEVSSTPRKNVSIELHSKSGAKEGSETSLFSNENVGNITYKSHGYIDLTELQFISMDLSYDRRAVSDDIPENFNIYLSSLSRNLPFFKETPSYYYMKNSYLEDEWAEKGLLLSHDSVDWMVKDVLTRVLNINITRKDAFLKTSLVKILYTDDNGCKVEDTITLGNIGEYYFDVDTKYIEADEEKIIKNRKKYDEILESAKTKKSKK